MEAQVVQAIVDVERTIQSWLIQSLSKRATMFATQRRFIPFFLIGICLSAISFSCKEYEYASQLPGILEIRLRTKSTIDTSIVSLPLTNPTTGTYSFMYAILSKIIARRPDGAQLELFSDLYAIRRNEKGDTVNCLGELVRDSAYVLGKAYAPPQTFTQIDLRLLPIFQFGVQLNQRFGSDTSNFYLGTFIELRRPRDLLTDLNQLPRPNQPPLNITIQEGRLTRVTITFDADSALVHRTEWCDYIPYFYVSSVQTF